MGATIPAGKQATDERSSKSPTKLTVTRDYLGPAVVTHCGAQTLSVELPDDSHAQAQMALAFTYEASVGDVVLIILRGERAYVIGVLHGSGQSVLTLPGNVNVRAANGTLRLSGDAGVIIDGPEVAIHATKLQMVAKTVMQKFTNVRQRVTELFSLHTGQSHTLVEGSSYSQAKSTAITTEDTITINGKSIHLG